MTAKLLSTGFDPQVALDKAKIELMTISTFISSMCFDMIHKFDDPKNPILPIPTAGTDGRHIIYDPNFFEKLTQPQRIGLIAHEVWHVAWGHLTRRGDRDPKIWNYAGDYVINLMLTQQGFILPETDLIDSQYRNMSTEEVYNKLKEKQDAGGKLPQSNMIGDILDKKLTEEEKKDLDDKVADMVSRAKVNTELNSPKEWGNMPSDVKRMFEELLEPQLNWKQILMQYLNEFIKDDYSWQRPNKRYLPNLYLPTQYSPTIGDVAIAIDTSGSISDEELKEILSEVEGIRTTFNPTSLRMFGADSCIHDEYEVDRYTDICSLKFGGGGGTSFHPVLDKLKKDPPRLLIYFTDLWAEHITDEPGFDTMWICNSDHEEQGIGHTIYIK